MNYDLNKWLSEIKASSEPIPRISEEDEFASIEKEASKRMREWSRNYMCQDINIRHSINYWIYLVCKERFLS